MKLKLHKTLLFCLGSALVAGTTYAQTDPNAQPGSSTGREFGRHAMMHGSQEIRASKITGAQVKSSTGENLGTIQDIVINPRNGRAEFAAISLTGPTGTTPTGAGEKLTLIPWKLLNASTTGTGAEQQPTFTAKVDQSKLSSAPSFDKNQWPDMSQRDWSQQYYSYFGVTPESGFGGTGTGMEKGESSPSTEKGSGASGLQPKSGTSYK
jgi:sporulation protein YlmC with PRC-barrel domain